MDRTYWHKQTPDKPLYPDLLWSQPENKRQAGKLLIAGGNVHGFAAPAEAFAEAGKAGVGTARVLLPDSLRQTVGRHFPAGEFAPSTPSGSFSRQALAPLLAAADWADAVLLTGDFGRNSETAVLLEQFLSQYDSLLTLTKDAVDYFSKTPEALMSRPQTLAVLSFAQLQKLAANAHFTIPFIFDMDLLHLVDTLHEFTQQHQLAVVVKHLDTMFLAVEGQVSTSKLTVDIETWRVGAAARGTVWWLQNPSKPFEALASSLVNPGR